MRLSILAIFVLAVTSTAQAGLFHHKHKTKLTYSASTCASGSCSPSVAYIQAQPTPQSYQPTPQSYTPPVPQKTLPLPAKTLPAPQ